MATLESVTTTDFRTQLKTILGDDLDIPAFETFFLITAGANMRILNDKEGDGKTIYCFDRKPTLSDGSNDEALATIRITGEDTAKQIQIAGLQKQSEVNTHLVLGTYETGPQGLELKRVGVGLYHGQGSDTVLPGTMPFMEDEFVQHLINAEESPLITSNMLKHTANPNKVSDNTLLMLNIGAPDKDAMFARRQITLETTGSDASVSFGFRAPFLTEIKMPKFQIPRRLSPSTA